jgi:hypothetical protein
MDAPTEALCPRLLSKAEAEASGLCAITYPFSRSSPEDSEDLASALRSFRKSPERLAALVEVSPDAVELWALPTGSLGAEKFNHFACRD